MPDLALADTDFPPGDFDFAGARVEHSKSGCEIVTMMKTAQPRHGNDFAVRVGVVPFLPAGGCALCQSEVRPVVMVVSDVLLHESFQMALVEHDDMVEEIAAASANPAFGHAVLPGTANGSANRDDAQTLYGLQNLTMESVLAIKD